MTAVTAQVHITSRRITSRARKTMLPEAAATTGCRNAEDALPPTAVSSVSSMGSILSMRVVMAMIVSFVCPSSRMVSDTAGTSTSTKQALRASEASASSSPMSRCVSRLTSSTGVMIASSSGPSEASSLKKSPSTADTASVTEKLSPPAKRRTASATPTRPPSAGSVTSSRPEKSSPPST